MASQWLEKDKGLTAAAMRKDRGEPTIVAGSTVGNEQHAHGPLETEGSYKGSKKRSSSFNPYFMAKDKDPEHEPPSCCSINCSVL